MGNLNDLINELSASKRFDNVFEELDSTVALSTRLTVAQLEKLKAICHVFEKKRSPMISDIVVSAMNDIIESMDDEQDREMHEFLSAGGVDDEIVKYILES